VTVIMRQILVKTAHNYRFEDWGDEELLEKMEELNNVEDSEDVRTRYLTTHLSTHLIRFHIRMTFGLLYQKPR